MDSEVLRFASFELDCRSRELREGARRVRLQDQPFEILRLMLEHPGDVVTREELRQCLWPEGTFVDFEHSLNAAIKRLRAALGDDADHPRFVETVPRRGYRFIAPLGGQVAPRPVAVAPSTRLVVLPFQNLSEDSSQEYFADGLTEELIAQLGPLCRGQVGVIARWSAMVFKGSLQRAREIGEALRVDHLLEGSVRRDGQRVRITARLVETASESELWSRTYERLAGDWLDVQADVAGLVARSLIQELVPRAPRGRRADEDPAAYQAYLRGRYHWAKPGDSGLVESLVAFEEATRLAPDFAAAHGGLARVRLGSAENYHALPRQELIAARESATRALELDPTVSEAVAVLADTRRMLDMDWSGAETGFRAALVLNPSNEYALRSFGVMLALRTRFQEAASHIDHACEMDPLCLMANTMAAWTRYVSGDVDRAIERCRHALDLFPEYAPARRLLGAAYLRAGDPARARAVLESVVAVSNTDAIGLAWLAHVHAIDGARAEARELIARAQAPHAGRYVPAFHIAIGYVGLDDHERAFEALDQAWLDRDPGLPTITVDPRFDPLRDDPRYLALLERMNIPGSGALDSGLGTRDPGFGAEARKPKA
jgi:TolB-like protein/DNA-binding winged helix-turn-helix (wHTH) protein/Tfp pilus assembly protein PilF